jgi:hypothetical protein
MDRKLRAEWKGEEDEELVNIGNGRKLRAEWKGENYYLKRIILIHRRIIECIKGA